MTREKPGEGWFEPNNLLDREVTEAFQNGQARLYTSGDLQFVVIDGGKNASRVGSKSAR